MRRQTGIFVDARGATRRLVPESMLSVSPFAKSPLPLRVRNKSMMVLHQSGPDGKLLHRPPAQPRNLIVRRWVVAGIIAFAACGLVVYGLWHGFEDSGAAGSTDDLSCFAWLGPFAALGALVLMLLDGLLVELVLHVLGLALGGETWDRTQEMAQTIGAEGYCGSCAAKLGGVEEDGCRVCVACGCAWRLARPSVRDAAEGG